jgi:hypothetical protein
MMSLKDEIEKMIEAELRKRANKKRRDKKRWEEEKEQDCTRFQLMHVLLTELAQSVEPCYLETHISDGAASLELCEPVEKNWDTGNKNWDIRWLISPHFEYIIGLSLARKPKPGIHVLEERNVRYPFPLRFLEKPEEVIHIFANEQKVMEYLVPKIVNRIVDYRQRADDLAKEIADYHHRAKS